MYQFIAFIFLCILLTPIALIIWIVYAINKARKKNAEAEKEATIQSQTPRIRPTKEEHDAFVAEAMAIINACKENAGSSGFTTPSYGSTPNGTTTSSVGSIAGVGSMPSSKIRLPSTNLDKYLKLNTNYIRGDFLHSPFDDDDFDDDDFDDDDEFEDDEFEDDNFDESEEICASDFSSKKSTSKSNPSLAEKTRNFYANKEYDYSCDKESSSEKYYGGIFRDETEVLHDALMGDDHSADYMDELDGEDGW